MSTKILQTDVQTERSSQPLERYVMMYIDTHYDNHPQRFPPTCFAYNSLMCESTGFCLVASNCGYEPYDHMFMIEEAAFIIEKFNNIESKNSQRWTIF